MKLRFLNMEEAQMNNIMFYLTMFVPLLALAFVLLILNGSAIDCVVLTMVLNGILVRIFEEQLGKYAKYIYVSIMPFWGAFVIFIGNNGKYGAMTQAYQL